MSHFLLLLYSLSSQDFFSSRSKQPDIDEKDFFSMKSRDAKDERAAGSLARCKSIASERNAKKSFSSFSFSLALKRRGQTKREGLSSHWGHPPGKEFLFFFPRLGLQHVHSKDKDAVFVFSILVFSYRKGCTNTAKPQYNNSPVRYQCQRV